MASSDTKWWMRIFDWPAKAGNRRPWDLFAVAMLGIHALGAVVASLSHRALYADGSYALFRILTTLDFFHFDPARQFAQYILNGPFLLAAVSGVKDLSVLSVIFGLTLFLHPVVSLAVSYRIVRRVSPALFLFPLISHSLLVTTTSFFMISEAHLGASLFWPMLLYVLTVERIKIGGGIVLAFASIILTRTYELMALCQGLLLVLLLLRGTRPNSSTTEGFLLKMNVVLVALGMAVDIWSALFYRNTTNRGTVFLYLFSELALTDYNLAGAAVLLGLLMFIAISPRSVRFMLSVPFITVLILLAIFPAIRPTHIMPLHHYAWRSLAVILPFVLGSVLAGYAAYRNNTGFSGELVLHVTVLTGALAICSLGWQIAVSNEWNGYRHEVAGKLRSLHGALPFEGSIMHINGPGPQTVTQFGFSWSVPYSTAMIQAVESGTVSSIVMAPAGAWSPPGESILDELPLLGRYGVHIDESLFNRP
jgi:hypothetical protein